MKKQRVVSLLLLTFSSCMVGPNYQPPEITIQEDWTGESEMGEVDEKWWDSFEDPLLSQYIHEADLSNFDLKIATARIFQARALRQVAASKLFPQIGLDMNGTKTYFSKNGPVFEIGQAAGDPSVTTSSTTGLPFTLQVPQIQNLFNFLFDASWEIDLFGKRRRELESAVAEYESLIEKRRDLLISVYAEVARSYIELRGFQDLARLQEQQILIFERYLEVIQESFRSGYVDRIAVSQIESELADTKGSLPEIYAEIYRLIYTISVLLGKEPQALVDELLIPSCLPEGPEKIALGLPSDLLRRRADIRYKEKKLHEATANVGVAVSSFFPTLSLLGNGGLQSLVFPELFNWGSRTFGYGADVNMPIFQGGRLIGNLHLSQNQEIERALEYQKAVLDALLEADFGIEKYKRACLSAKEYEKSALEYEKIVLISKLQYQKGLIDLPSFLKEETKLIEKEIRKVKSKQEKSIALVALYKALGGGWEVTSLPEKCAERETTQ